MSETYPFHSEEADGMRKREQLEEYFTQSLEVDTLLRLCPDDEDILGTPGSGKSFAAKREICNAFLVTDDDIIIADPEAEYAPLVERLHGQVIHISPASTQYINPLDINSITAKRTIRWR